MSRDEVRRLGHAQRLPHLLVGGVGLAVAEVRGDGAAEEVGLLGHEADGGGERVGVEVAHVDAADEHPAVGGVEEAGDEVDQGGLARAGAADDGRRRAGRDREVDVAEHGVLGAGVVEADVVQLEVAAAGEGGDGVGGRSRRTTRCRAPPGCGRRPPTPAGSSRR